jgi:uncharacterized Zn finger protein
VTIDRKQGIACPGCRPVAETMLWLVWFRAEQNLDMIETAHGQCKECGWIWYASLHLPRDGETSVSLRRHKLEDLSR